MAEGAAFLASPRNDDGDYMNYSLTEAKRIHECILDSPHQDISPNKKQAIEYSNSESVSEVSDANISTLENVPGCKIISAQPDIGSRIIASNSSSDSNSSDPRTTFPMASEDSKPLIFIGGNGKLKIKLNKSKNSGNVWSTSTYSKFQEQNVSGPSCGGHGRLKNQFSPEPCESLKEGSLVDLREKDLGDTSEMGISGTIHRYRPHDKMELKMSKKVSVSCFLGNATNLEGVPVNYASMEVKEEITCLDSLPAMRKFFPVGTESFQAETSIAQKTCGKVMTPEQSQLLTPVEALPIVSSLKQDTEDKLGHDSSSLIQCIPTKQKCTMLEKNIQEPIRFPKNRLPRLGSLHGSPSDSFTAYLKNNVPQNGSKKPKRDNDLHRILFTPRGLPDRTKLAYYSKGQRILEGYKWENGIVCSCCNAKISPSQFEAHAGCASRRQPYRHIHTSDGLSLHDLSLSLSNDRDLAIADNDDICHLCGDGGELLLCDGCTQAFHTACLGLQSLPEGCWYCSHCVNCGPGRKGRLRNTFPSKRGPITIRLRRVVQAPATDIGGCVFCRGHDFSADTFNARTVLLCDQCEKEHHVGCLKDRGLCDLKELPKGNWFCSEDCSRVHTALKAKLDEGVKIISSSQFSIERKERGIANEIGDLVQWQLLSGRFGSPDQRMLLSRAAAIFQDCFDPIAVQPGCDLIPSMVYGQNIAGQEFGGMFCAVLIVNSLVISAGIFRVFGTQVAELPLVATCKESQRKGYFQLLFSYIEDLLGSLKVETLILPAAEEKESIWTNKFGFSKMTEERINKYTRENQIMVFQGTSMLEKAVPQIQD